MSDDGQEVTYTPAPGDPRETTFRGVTFKAGEPQRVKDASHLAALEANPYFSVEKREDKAKAQDDGEKSSEDRRREFVERLQGEKSVEGLIRAFAAERKRREDAKADTGDLDQLQSHLADRITEMRMREGMGTRQVAELWMKYGMAER